MALRLAILAVMMIAPRAANGQVSSALPDTVRLQHLELELPESLSPFPGQPGQGTYTVGRIGLKPMPLLVPIDLNTPTIVTDGPGLSLSRWVVPRGSTLIRRRMALRWRTLFESSAPARTLPVVVIGGRVFVLASGGHPILTLALGTRAFPPDYCPAGGLQRWRQTSQKFASATCSFERGATTLEEVILEEVIKETSAAA